jgi:hypothetical protein
MVATAARTTPAWGQARSPSGEASSQAPSVARPASATTATPARQARKQATVIVQEGEPCIGRAGRRHTRLKTSVPLVPPKPKLFLTACSIFISRAALAQ